MKKRGEEKKKRKKKKRKRKGMDLVCKYGFLWISLDFVWKKKIKP